MISKRLFPTEGHELEHEGKHYTLFMDRYMGFFIVFDIDMQRVTSEHEHYQAIHDFVAERTKSNTTFTK